MFDHTFFELFRCLWWEGTHHLAWLALPFLAVLIQGVREVFGQEARLEALNSTLRK